MVGHLFTWVVYQLTCPITFIQALSVSGTPDCLQLVSTCLSNAECREIQGRYLQECSSAFKGQECSQTCKNRYSQLLRNSIGSQYYYCSCKNADSLCAVYKRNLLKQCFGGIAPTLGSLGRLTAEQFNSSSGSPSCVSLHSACSTLASTCDRRYQSYFITCEDAFSGIKCSPQCNHSVYDMLKYPISNGFLSCDCLKDSLCRQRVTNLSTTCYNGKTPLASSVTAVTPTDFSSGSCEALLQECFSTNYRTCGTTFQFIPVKNLCDPSNGQSGSNSASCSTICKNGLQQLVSTTGLASKVSTCNCTNVNSSECRSVMEYRRTFILCDVTNESIASTTPAITESSQTWCESISSKCKTREINNCDTRDVFHDNCSYLFSNSHSHRQVNLSIPCRDDCRLELAAVANTDVARVIINCVCRNASSSACHKVLAYQSVFGHCGISAGTVTASPGLDGTPTATDGSTIKALNYLVLIVVIVVQCFVMF